MSPLPLCSIPSQSWLLNISVELRDCILNFLFRFIFFYVQLCEYMLLWRQEPMEPEEGIRSLGGSFELYHVGGRTGRALSLPPPYPHFLLQGGKAIGHVGLLLLSHFRRLLPPTAQPSSRIFHAGCIWCKWTSTPDDYTSVNTPNDPRVPVSLFKCTCCSSIRVRARGGQTWCSLLRLQPQPYLYEEGNSH